jgi:hypothetical protein
METARQQPAIVIAAADPEWAFGLQARLRSVIGWDYDILITFTAQQALDYVLRRSAALLISAPRMARRAYVMDVPELLAAVGERAPATPVLLADEAAELTPGAEELFAAACQIIGAAPATSPDGPEPPALAG